MASGGKKRTTMAKLARENRLRERRLAKQAKKDARRHAQAHDAPLTDMNAALIDTNAADSGPTMTAGEPTIEPIVELGADAQAT
jgi:hypothetical protein